MIMYRTGHLYSKGELRGRLVWDKHARVWFYVPAEYVGALRGRTRFKLEDAAYSDRRREKLLLKVGYPPGEMHKELRSQNL